jgi:hypothetical protein
MFNKQVLAWTFLFGAFCSETWRIVSKYCELFVLTDPFQDKVETLTTCYGELCHTSDQVLLQSTPGSLDIHLHILSHERLEDIHVRVLQAQQAWLVEKCLRHEVPSAKELLLMAKRQARLLREHDACKYQLHALIASVHSVREVDAHTAKKMSPPPTIPSSLVDHHDHQQQQRQQPQQQSEEGPEEDTKLEEKKECNTEGAGKSQGPVHSPRHTPHILHPFSQQQDLPDMTQSLLRSCELLYTVYNGLLDIMLLIFRIYPTQADKLRALYRPANSTPATENREGSMYMSGRKDNKHGGAKSKSILSMDMDNEDKL